jgi:hypothetical protein
VSVEGRSGIAGAEEEVEEDDMTEEDCGVGAEKPVDDATEDDKAVIIGSRVSIYQSEVNITG